MKPLALLLGLVAATGIACAPEGERSAPRASNGEIDLTGWDFTTDGPVRLSGEWRLYWSSLVPPAAVPWEGGEGTLIVAPGSWNHTSIDGRALPGQGYATHTLKVRLPAASGGLAIALGEMNSAMHLYANGRSVLERGSVGVSRATEVPNQRPGSVRLDIDGPELELVLQISNHFHFEGGPVRDIEIGLAEEVEGALARSAKFDYLVMGCVLIIGLHYGLLFAMRPSEKAHLLFALLSFIVLLRVAVTNWYILDIFPSLSMAGVLRLDYVTLFTAPPAYYGFLRALFPMDCPRLPARASTAFAALGLVSLISPTWNFTLMRGPAELVAIAVTATATLCIVRAAFKGRAGAWFVVAGVLVVLLAVSYDILYRERVIEGSHDVIPLSLIFFVASLASLLGIRSGRAFRTSERLAERLRELNLSLEARVAERTAELERLATTDALTGLNNRRSLMSLAETERSRAARYGQPLAVLILDVDHFKRVNDLHGHQAGDAVLKAMGEALLSAVRSHDVLGRYGGEEFVVMMSGLDAEGAVLAAERLRSSVAEMEVPRGEGNVVRVTASVGIAMMQTGEGLDRLLARADRALYAAKTSGRNRVVTDQA